VIRSVNHTVMELSRIGIQSFPEREFAISPKRHYNRRTFEMELMDREAPLPIFETGDMTGKRLGLALPEFPGGSLDPPFRQRGET